MAALLLLTAGSTWAQDKLVRYDEKAFEKLAKEMNEDTSNPYVSSWAKDVFRSYCEMESVQVDFTEKSFQDTLRAKANVEKKYNKLLDDKTEADTAIALLKRDKRIVEANMKKQNKVIDSLNRLIANKDKEKEKLEGRVAKYENAFKKVKETINGIYDGNMANRLVNMDVTELDEADSAWIGMKDMLESANPILADELRGKVEEINLWKSAVEPMQGAVKYMKGKYNDDDRQTWIEKLKNLNLKGEMDKERTEVVTALEDEEAIKECFDKIMRNLLVDYVCFPDKEQMKNAQEMIVRMKSKVQDKYHPNYYDSYDNAIKNIETELGMDEPSITIDNKENFAKFINGLKETF